MDLKLNSQRILHALILFAGSTVAVLGLLAIIDIQTDSRLVHLFPDAMPLHFNTALGLFALGVALLAYLTEYYFASSVIGATIHLFGLFSLVQLYLAHDLGVKKELVKLGNVQVAIGARFSPISVICFLLAGLALALARRSPLWCRMGVGILAGFVLAISGVAILGYLAHFPAGFTWGSYTPVTPVVAIAFFVLGIGLFAVSVQEEMGRGPLPVHWMPVQVGSGLLFATLVLFTSLIQQEQWKAEKNLKGKISDLKKELQDRFEVQVNGLGTLALRWDNKDSNEAGLWERNAQIHMGHFPAYQSIERYSKDLKLQWITAKEKEEERFQRPLNDEAKLQFDLVRRSRLPRALRNDPAERQFKRFRVAFPLFKEDRFDGFLVGTFRMTSLVQTALEDESFEGIHFTLSDEQGEIFARGSGQTKEALEEQTLSLYGYDWKLKAWFSSGLLQSEKTLLPEAVLFFGTCISGLIALLIYFIGIFVKRTRDLQISQEETMLAKEEALKASQSKTEFLANVSHEIRTPMNAIQGMTNLLGDSKLSTEQRDFVDGIKFSADSLLSLINDVLDLAKIEAGKMELESTDFDLRKVLVAILDVFQLTSKQKGIHLKLDYPEEIPSVFQGDPYRLRQVLTNLIGNAVKFTEKGWIKVAAEVVPVEQSLFTVKILVSDTGLGIPRDKQDRMFQSFSQGDSSMTRKFGGTGLGLSISKRIIELMSGNIQFESEEGRGSQFWFSIPLKKGTVALIETTPLFDVRESSANKRILVAEDNPLNRKVAAKVLGRFGYLVDTVANGKEALESMELTSYDAVILDCQMPVLDGYGTSLEIRKREENTGQHIPLIALTAHAMVSDRKKCLDAGMDEYLSKPFDPKKLRNVIEVLTEEKTKALAFGASADKKNKKKTKMKRIDTQMLQEVISLKEVDGFAFANELLTLFSKTTPKELARIEKALKGKNLARVVDTAHALKSGSANLGATLFHHLCKSLERSARNGELAKSRKIFSELRIEFSKTDAELKREVKNLFESRESKAA